MPINNYDDMVDKLAKDEGIEAPPLAPEPAEKYDNILDQEKFGRQKNLQGSMFNAVQTQPDAYAKVMQLSAKAGVAPELIKDDVDNVQRDVELKSVDYGKLIDQSPGTASWLEDTNNMAVSRDDIDALKGIESSVRDHSIFTSMGQALGSGLSTLYTNAARVPALMFDVAAVPQNLLAKYAPGLKDTEVAKAIGYTGSQVKAPDWLQNNPVATHYEKLSSQFHAPEMDQSVVEHIGKGEYSKAGQTLAVQFVQNFPNQAAMLAAALSGYQVPALVAAGLQEGASANTAAKEKGVEPLQATQNALLHGTAEALLEKVGTFGVLKKWENVIAKQYSKDVSKQVVIDLFKTLGYSFASEATEEASTSIIQDYTDYVTGVNPELTLRQALTHAADAGIQGGLSGVLMSSPAGAIQGHQRTQQIRQAQLTRDFYLAFGKTAEATKLRERLPEKQKEFISHVTKGTEVEHIYIPIEAIETHFQGKDGAVVRVMQEVGVLDAYNDSKETGADLKIPLAAFANKFVGTPEYKALADDVKFDPQAMTLNQSKEFGAEIKKTAEESKLQAEGVVDPNAEQQNVEQQTEQLVPANIREKVKEQLVASGKYNATEADTQSLLYESAFNTLAERAGVDPQALFDQYNLKINARNEPAASGGVVLNQDDPIVKNANPAIMGVAARPSEIEILKQKLAETEAHLGEERRLRRTSEVTGIRNKMAFDEDASLNWPGVAAVDMDGLKKLNDQLGHEAGDTVLKAIGATLLKAQGDGDNVRFYHRSGDEFAGRFKTAEQAEQFMADLQKKLETVDVEISENGVVKWVYQGIGISYGAEENYDKADKKSNAQKVERFRTGKREDSRNAGPTKRVITLAEYNAGLEDHSKTGGSKNGPGTLNTLDYIPTPTLTPFETAAEQRTAESLSQSDADARYDAQPESHGGKYISADTAALITPDFKTKEQRQIHSESVYSPAAFWAFQRYKRDLAKPSVQGVVTFLGGGTGSGKTSSLENHTLDTVVNSSDIVYDSTMSNYAQSEGKIQMALDSGRGAVYYYVYTPIEKSAERVAERYAREGRTIRPRDVVASAINSQETFLKLYEKYKDNPMVVFKPIDNSGERGTAKSIDVEKVEKLRYTKGTDSIDDAIKKFLPAVEERLSHVEQETSEKRNEAARSESERLQSEGGQDRSGTSGQSKPEGFNQKVSNTIRGQIRFGKDGINIDLLKDANLSTFLHETGHFYLKVVQDLASQEATPQQIKDDYQSILKFLENDGGEITVDQHEKFARAFETYLMEGKAPTQKLQKAFSRFRVWLVDIYRRISGLVQLTPEVRQVFDRMLATDAEISKAEAQFNFDPLFPNPESFGMEGKKAEAYITAREEARTYAENTLMAKLMASHVREKSGYYREQRKKTRDRIEAEVNEMNLYKAIANFQKGTMPDGSPLPEGSNQIKLDKQFITDNYGKNFLGNLPRAIAAPDGMNPEIAAQLYGFENADVMLQEMVNASKREDLIEQQTDEAMKDFYPDIINENPKAMSEEAVNAIFNEKRAHMNRLELEHIATMNTPTLKEVGRRVTRKLPTEQEVRAMAEKIIGRQAVRDVKPYIYQRAAAKNRKEAGEALAKGEFDRAYEANRKELLNNELSRAAIEANERFEKDRQLFRKIARTDEKLSATRDTNLIGAARAVLSAFGIGEQDKAPADYLNKIKTYDPDAYERVVALVNSATEGAGPVEQVSYDQYVAMSDAARALWDLAKSIHETEVDGKRESYDAIIEQLSTKISAIAGEEKKTAINKSTTLERGQKLLQGWEANLNRVESWVEAMDGGPSGPFRNYIWNPISEKVAKYRLAREPVYKGFDAALQKIKGTIQRTPIAAPELNNDSFKDKTQLLMALLHTGNESNKSKLVRGYGWTEEQWDRFEKRMQDEGVLTKKDYDFAQEIWDLMESLKPGAQKSHKQIYGYYFNEITANEKVTPFGTYKGGYIPAKVDTFTNEDARIRKEREEFENGNNSFQFPTTGRGFTKSRVEEYAAPLSLELSMLKGHIDGVLRFTHIQPAVKQVSRIVMDQGFRKNLSNINENIASEMLVPWLQRSASQKVVNPSLTGEGKAVDAVAKFLRKNVAMQVMVGNLVNTAQQFTGLIVAMSKVAPKYIRNGLVTYMQDIRGTTEMVMEKSEWMRANQGSNIYEVQEQIDQIILEPSAFEKAQDFAQKHTYFLQSAAQNVVNTITWVGAYEQAIAKELEESKAVKEADSAVRLTQGTQNAEDVSRFETGTATKRLFTQFAGYFNMLYNLNKSEITKIARDVGLKKGAGRLLYLYLTAFAIPAILSEAIVKAASGRDLDDDDDGYLDDMLALLFGSQFKTATAMVPYAGAFINATYNNFNKQTFDDRMNLSPVVSILESVGTAVPAELYKAISGDMKNKKKVTKDVLQLMGIATGLPIGPIGKPVGYMMDVKSGKARPKNALDYTRGLVTGRPGN